VSNADGMNMKPYRIKDPSNPRKYFNLVAVEWGDARGDSGWHSFEDAVDAPLVNITTIGLLIHKDKERIVLAAQWDRDVAVVSEITTIPRTWQTKITYLGVVDGT